MTTAITELSPQAVLPQVSTPCLQRLNARPWHRTIAVRTGPMLVGVRVDTPAAAAAVDQMLAPARAPEMDERVAPNFSVELGDASTGGSRRQLRLIYRDHQIAARRRSVDEVLLDLVELLDEVPLLFVTSAPVLQATGVLTPGGDDAVLLPARLHKTLLVRRRQLADAGLELLRTRAQRLTVGGELLLGMHDATLGQVLRDNLSDERATAGTRRIRVLGAPAVGNAPFEFRAPEGVFAAFAMVINRQTIGAAPTLQALSGLTEGTRFLGVPDLSAGSLARAVIQIAG